MKRFLVLLWATGLIFSLPSSLMAEGIDHKINYSAEWMRTLNRNAATDSADAVVYNPAGVTRMEDGFYGNLSTQYILKEYSNTFGGTKYESDEPDIVPSVFALYRKDKWAAYTAFTIPCGGGTVDFKDGMASTWSIAQGIAAGINAGYAPLTEGLPVYEGSGDHGLEAELYYYGVTVGGAYAVNDWLSLSLGVRYIDAIRELEGFATLRATDAGTSAGLRDETPQVKYEETGDGWGGIFGVSICPTDELNIGIRYETETSLTLKTKEKRDTLEDILLRTTGVVSDGIVTDGAKRNRDFPALLGLGASYIVTPNLRAEANLVYYLNDDADWDDDPIAAGDQTKKDNGYDTGIALEYTFNPQFKGSVGYMYTETGIDADDMSRAAPELDAHTIAGGVAYEAVPGLNLNLGVLKVFYEDDRTSPSAVFPNGVKLEKDVVIVAFGIQYKFL